MARKRRPPSRTNAGTVTADRSARFYQLLRLLRDGPKARNVLVKKLRLDLRGFYRDLEKLREFGIPLRLSAHTYRLAGSFERAISRLPFPDPQLSWHDALLLAHGATRAHRKLRRHIAKITKGRRSN